MNASDLARYQKYSSFDDLARERAQPNGQHKTYDEPNEPTLDASPDDSLVVPFYLPVKNVGMGQSGLIHSINGREAYYAGNGKIKKFESFYVDRVRPTQFRNFHEMKAESDTRYKSLHKVNKVRVTTNKHDRKRVRIQTIESKTMTNLSTYNANPSQKVLETLGTYFSSKIPNEDPNNVAIACKGGYWEPRKSQNWSSRMVGDTMAYERKFDFGPPGYPAIERKKTNKDDVLNKLLSDTRQMIRHKVSNVRDWD